MTRDEINALDLDALNVECAKAFGGYTGVHVSIVGTLEGFIIGGNGQLRAIPNYSRDIGAAGVLWRWLFEHDYEPCMSTMLKTIYFSVFVPRRHEQETRNPDDIPAMICRAFLAAKEKTK